MFILVARILISAAAFLPFAAGVWQKGAQEAARIEQNRTPDTAGRLGRGRSINRSPLIGDFPEYRPGAREAGLETFWR